MSAPLAAAVAAPQTGLLDLERELICSVSIVLNTECPSLMCILMSPDLYRNTLPTSYPH
jgi:hypothetical protein